MLDLGAILLAPATFLPSQLAQLILLPWDEYRDNFSLSRLM